MFRSLWCGVAATINRRPSASSSSSSASATRYILCTKVVTDSRVSHIPFCFCSTSSNNFSSDYGFVISYLINSCGLSENVAITVCKKIDFKTSSKPNSVLKLFENYGFTKPHISKLITKLPFLLIHYDPLKTLKPKLDFFNSKGLHGIDLAEFISRDPFVLTRSLKDQLIPSFDILNNIVDGDTNVIKLLKGSTWVLNICVVEMLILNLEILRYEGVHESTMIKYLIWDPRSFTGDADKFKKIVEKVKRMGFDPLATTFLVAIQGLAKMSEATWKTKLVVFERWGWSDDQIQTAFRKNPRCMMASEKKITAIMDFLVNEMGYDSLSIAETPMIFNVSLNERIIPRCSVIRVLVSKGLIKKNIPLNILSTQVNKYFLDRFVKPYVQEAPELMKVFQGQLRLEWPRVASEMKDLKR